MPRCEDFPCCGHEPGDCPSRRRDGSEVWRCVECGGKLPRSASSSICERCMRLARRRVAQGLDMFPEGNDYGFANLTVAIAALVVSALLVAGILYVGHLAEVAARALPLQ